MKPPPPRILALDLGKKRIGLAISDPLGITAQGLPNLNRTNKRADLAALEALAATREVGLILMGNPINMRGAEGRQSGWVREFAAALEAHTRLPVKLWDERLTSVEAGRVLRASGISIEKRAAAVDRLSAVILLQSYLDSLGASFGLGPGPYFHRGDTEETEESAEKKPKPGARHCHRGGAAETENADEKPHPGPRKRARRDTNSPGSGEADA
ncbi:MAG: Holliday junction resolvase RuvX [Bryobacteraceae bacterium]